MPGSRSPLNEWDGLSLFVLGVLGLAALAFIGVIVWVAVA